MLISYQGDVLNQAAIRGHATICAWIINEANDQQKLLLFSRTDVRSLPNYNCLATIALYRLFWNNANVEIRQNLLTNDNYLVFRTALVRGLFPICQLLMNNATIIQQDVMLRSGINELTNSQSWDIIKAYRWLLKTANADQRNEILNSIIKNQSNEQIAALFHSLFMICDLSLVESLWEKITLDRQNLILNSVYADLLHDIDFPNDSLERISSMEDTLIQAQQAIGAHPRPGLFFQQLTIRRQKHDASEENNSNKSKKP